MNSMGLLKRIDSDTEAHKQILSMRKLTAHGMAESSERFNPSPDQEKALATIDAWLTSSEPLHSLIGPAGSGKSTLMAEVLKLARNKRWPISLSAPTHQAAARLKDATGRHSETIHRVMGCRIVRCKKTGKEGLKVGIPSIEPGTLLIVDESSMLMSMLLEIIVKFAKKSGCKVLFVGDKAQLNPVMEKPCPAVSPEHCEWGMSELKTIHRQAAENPIIAAATRVRLAEPQDLIRFETGINKGQGIQVYSDKREWADAMLSGCANDEEANRYIAYTNRATDEAAKAVRRHVYGEESAKPYLPGEKVIVNSRVVLEPEKKRRKRKSKKQQQEGVIQANDSARVLSCYKAGELYQVECDWNGKEVTLNAFENYQLREQCLAKLRISAIQADDWTTFFDTKDTVADLRSAVSLTAHSSQGSTFDDVFINLDQISMCYNREERQRLLYVALTRASRTAHLTGELR